MKSPSNIQFHVLSFEGPDPYSRSGGIATRIIGLTGTLADLGFDTHLWFIGDPAFPGAERSGNLWLHRWCQWISRYHPGGVYDGEEGKRSDFVSSLPPVLSEQSILPFLSREHAEVIVLAEEWQTVDAVLHLDWLLRRAGVRERVAILWNANNTFGFERIDWPALARAAVITTVSRYMRQRMWSLGVDPVVIPNGLSQEAYQAPDQPALVEFRHRVRGRVVLAKVARWDPDKRWILAIQTVAALKGCGWRPLLIARGGQENDADEVVTSALGAGLRVEDRHQLEPGVAGLLGSLTDLRDADVLILRSPMTGDACRVLFRGAGAVLANSGHEPFGLVGLEAMAVGGLACTGGTGEDYAIPGWNGLVLQSEDPTEFLRHFQRLRRNPVEERALRRRGQMTARWFGWPEIVRCNLLPQLADGSGRAVISEKKRRSAPTTRARRSADAFLPADGVPIAARSA